VFGKKFSEYVQFEWWILTLIAVVWAIRLGLSLAGTTFEVDRWISINIVLLLGLIYCSIAVHLRRFGSYKQLFGLLLVQTVFAHILIACGIVLGIITGTDNIFTIPEVSGGGDGKSWGHVAAHAIAGFVLPVITWLIGSALLFVTKKSKPVV
jgi:hypothetical protein